MVITKYNILITKFLIIITKNFVIIIYLLIIYIYVFIHGYLIIIKILKFYTFLLWLSILCPLQYYNVNNILYINKILIIWIKKSLKLIITPRKRGRGTRPRVSGAKVFLLENIHVFDVTWHLTRKVLHHFLLKNLK